MTERKLECKHVAYTPSLLDPNKDLVILMEVEHHPDGTYTRKPKMIENYMMDFHITKKAFRNHKEKKEYEDIKRLDRYRSNRASMASKIARVLNLRPQNAGSIRRCADSPYLYGTDVTPEADIKARYKKKWPDTFSKNRVAAFDVETNMFTKEQEIILASTTMKEKVILYIDRKFISETDYSRKKLDEVFEKYMGKIMRMRGIKSIEYKWFDDEGELSFALVNDHHSFDADFLAAWNIGYDLDKITTALEKYNYDLGECFSHPAVPREYRYAVYDPAKTSQVANSGKTKTKHPSELWHVMRCPATHYYIDAMATYRTIRAAKGLLPSYSLNAILDKELKIQKLAFTELAESEGGEWHKDMQSKYPFEYAVYNVFDCIAIEMLDEKTADLSTTISALSGTSCYSLLPKQPTRLANNFAQVCEENGKVMGTTGSTLVTEFDSMVVGASGWVVTLDSNRMAPGVGLNCFPDYLDYDGKPIFNNSSIFLYVADLDCVSTYPTSEAKLNIGKSTTKFEFVEFKGISYDDQRMLSINMTGGPNNAVHLMNKICDLSTHQEMFSAYVEAKASTYNGECVEVETV